MVIRRRPGSPNQLQRVVRAYAREYGLAEKRVRDWISYMAICGALERTGTAGHSPPHYVKGGVALGFGCLVKHEPRKTWT